MELQGERNVEWPKVVIIILNWNGWRDTIECLESVYQISYPNYDVLVLDNGSEDESIKKLQDYCDGKIHVKSEFIEYDSVNKPIEIIKCPRCEADKEYDEKPALPNFDKRLIIIENEKNYGFAEGNNIAMRFALGTLAPKYFLLLNNDTVVDTGFLEKLVKVGETEEMIGVIGPAIYHYNDSNKVQSAGVKICWNSARQNVLRSNEINSSQFEDLVDADSVSGCAFLAKADLVKKIGYLNSNYFAYWEETEWCIRASRAGYKIFCAPKSKVWHKLSSTSTKIGGFIAYYGTRNMFWFMRQYATRRQYHYFMLYFFGFRFWLSCGIYIIYRTDIRSFIYFLRGILDGVFHWHHSNKLYDSGLNLI